MHVLSNIVFQFSANFVGLKYQLKASQSMRQDAGMRLAELISFSFDWMLSYLMPSCRRIHQIIGHILNIQFRLSYLLIRLLFNGLLPRDIKLFASCMKICFNSSQLFSSRLAQLFLAKNLQLELAHKLQALYLDQLLEVEVHRQYFRAPEGLVINLLANQLLQIIVLKIVQDVLNNILEIYC